MAKEFAADLPLLRSVAFLSYDSEWPVKRYRPE